MMEVMNCARCSLCLGLAGEADSASRAIQLPKR